MTKKIPSGVKRWLIERTGSTYHRISHVLDGTSTDVKLMEQVSVLLAEYNQIQEDLSREISAL